MSLRSTRGSAFDGGTSRRGRSCLHLVLGIALASAVVGTASVPAAEAKKAAKQSITAQSAKTAYDQSVAKQRDIASRQRTLESTYEAELAAVDKLKKQRPSWKRDRELQAALAKSADTAKKLEALVAQRTVTDRNIATSKTLLLAAIAGELPLASGKTRTQLLAWKSGLQTTGPRKKVVLPDMRIDPYADPEDLREQALEARQAEDALAREVDLLMKQATRWQQVVELREQASRSSAIAMAQTVDDRRVNVSGSTEGTIRTDDRPSSEAPSPLPPGTPEAEPTQIPTDTGVIDPSVPQLTDDARSSAAALADVIDLDTRKSLESSDKSRDPAIKAAAALRAQKQAKMRLDALRLHRAALETRAKSLK